MTGVLPAGPASPSDGRLTARALAVLLMIGGALGLLNLPVEGVVREGTAQWAYGTTMAACMLAGVLLAVRRRAGVWTTFGLVLLGDVIYVVVALSVVDAAQYATPLMLLFCAFIAAWFLGPWMLTVQLLVTPLACLVALWGSFDSPAALVIQVVVSTAVLDSSSIGVFVLRRRIERLLEVTRAATRQDDLTDLHNRRHLAEQAPRLWRQARREGLRIAAMVLDLDHFKRINDTHGHSAGDAVLQAVAGALSATVRPTDLLARTGGEELVVVGLVADAVEAGHLGERLRAAVASARSGDGHGVTASIGVAITAPVDGEDATAALWRLVDRADAAMYEAKRAGRDRVSPVRQQLPRPARRDALGDGSVAATDPPATDAA